MADEGKGDHRTQVTLAIIALIGTISAGLFANWEKIFPPSPVPPPDTVVVVVPSSTGDTVRDSVIVDTSRPPPPDTTDSSVVGDPPITQTREVTCAENQGPSDDPASNQECSLLEDEVEQCQVGDNDSDGLYDEWLSASPNQAVAFGPWENPNCIVGGAAISGSGWHLGGLGSCGQGGTDVKRCRRVRGTHTFIGVPPDTE